MKFTAAEHIDPADSLYHEEKMILDATELICELMDDQGITRAELAKRLGKTRGYVTQMLDGGRNMTIRTMAKMSHVLGREIHFFTCPTANNSAAGQQ